MRSERNYDLLEKLSEHQKNKDAMRYRVMPYRPDYIKVSTPVSTESRKLNNYRDSANRFESCIAHSSILLDATWYYIVLNRA